jgi:hypothetical protein
LLLPSSSSGLLLPSLSPQKKHCCRENAQAKRCPFHERIDQAIIFKRDYIMVQQDQVKSLIKAIDLQENMNNERLV